MGDPTASFAVNLEDGTSGAALKAAGALETLKKKINADVKALNEMKRAMKRLQGGTSVNVAAFKELQAKIDSQKSSIAVAQSKFVQLGGTFEKTRKRSAKAAFSFRDLGSAAQGTGGPVGTFGLAISKLGAFLSSPITLVLALGAAMLTLAGAIGVATVALLKFAVTSSDARREEALQIEGLNTLRQQYGRTTASVGAMQAAIDKAADSTNIGRSTLQQYARQLSRTGLRGDALTDAVEAMGIAAMVQGDRGAQRFRALAHNARLTGGSVVALAEQYKRRLGPIARRQMLSIGNQTKRLRDNLDLLFKGVRIEVFLSALEKILSLFSQSTATGRALKTIMETIFNPIIKQVSKIGPLVKRFFQGMVIAALIVLVALLKLGLVLKKVFGDTTFLQDVDKMNLALDLGAIAMGAIIGVIAVLALGFVALAAAVLIASAPFLILIDTAKRVIDFFGQIDFASIGKSMVDGLIRGIQGQGAALVKVVKGIASSVSSTFKSALGIASPSKTFANFGANISAGVEQGIDSGSGDVNAAAGGLVEEPTGGGVGGGGGSVSISIGDIAVNAGEATDPRALALAFRDELAAVLEGMSIELGAA